LLAHALLQHSLPAAHVASFGFIGARHAAAPFFPPSTLASFTAPELVAGVPLLPAGAPLLAGAPLVPELPLDPELPPSPDVSFESAIPASDAQPTSSDAHETRTRASQAIPTRVA
jgi:hypothetical protein